MFSCLKLTQDLLFKVIGLRTTANCLTNFVGKFKNFIRSAIHWYIFNDPNYLLNSFLSRVLLSKNDIIVNFLQQNIFVSDDFMFYQVFNKVRVGHSVFAKDHRT